MNIDQIIAMNRKAGFHFFDKETLACFNSSVLPETFPCFKYVYFVTSEQYENEPRHYKVRVFSRANCRVSTPPELNQFETEVLAQDAARKLAASNSM